MRNDGGPPIEVSPPADSEPSRSALCGTTGCFPGNRSACGVNPTGDAAGYDYPFSDGGDSATTDGPEGGSSDAAADVTSSQDATDASSVPDAPGDVGSTDEPRTTQSCYINPAEAGAGVTTQCEPAGHVGEGGACDDSSDCIALYACVDVDSNNKGVCRGFSCALPISCPAGFFYRRASLRVAGTTRGDLEVPVCLPNDHCTPLLEKPNPCTRPMEVCAVVGSQGETGCLKPGNGQQGDSCDEDKRCGKGLLCSKFNDQCVRLCHVAADVTECAGGTCQGGNKSIPEGFGICVGEIPDSSR